MFYKRHAGSAQIGATPCPARRYGNVAPGLYYTIWVYVTEYYAIVLNILVADRIIPSIFDFLAAHKNGKPFPASRLYRNNDGFYGI